MAPTGNCQWIITNLVQEDREQDGAETVGCCMKTAVLHRAGMKIGFIGLAEGQWTNLFKNLEIDLIYQNYKRTAVAQIKKLREQEGCDFIIALTHMRVRHDEIIAKEVLGVDLVLGGHDHEYHCKSITHELKDQSQGPSQQGKVVPVVKSGHDFADMSEIDVTFDISQEQFSRFQTEFVSRHEDQQEVYSWLMYS